MFTSEHCMMQPWHQLCQVEMINKPNDVLMPGVEKVDSQVSEE